MIPTRHPVSGDALAPQSGCSQFCSTKFMIVRSLLYLLALVWLIPLGAGIHHNLQADRLAKAPSAESPVPPAFALPAVPATLVDPQVRADYVALNYWASENLDSGRWLASAADSVVLERVTVDWLEILHYASPEGRIAAVDALIDKTSNDTAMFYYLNDLLEKYLYGPNSAMLDEELFDTVLACVVESEAVDPSGKIRPRALRERIAMNRPGTLAADFAYELPSGKRSLLSAIRADYTLIYFYNPDCADCREVKDRLRFSPVIASMIAQGALKVLALYPDQDPAIWREHLSEMPAEWINARDPRGQVKDALYALNAIPSLYLLDQEKTVMLKDASFDRVEQTLVRANNTTNH